MKVVCIVDYNIYKKQFKETGVFLFPKSVRENQNWTKKMSKNGKWKYFTEKGVKICPMRA